MAMTVRDILMNADAFRRAYPNWPHPESEKGLTMTTTDNETMTVTVRDRSAEAPWGSGMTSPVIRDITISAYCPIDGERRGVPVKQRYHDDGVDYWVSNWRNPCGHTDMYPDVINEARAMVIDEAEPVRDGEG